MQKAHFAQGNKKITRWVALFLVEPFVRTFCAGKCFRGHKLNGKLSVSKTELLGSNPSAPDHIRAVSSVVERNIDIVEAIGSIPIPPIL